MSGNTRPLPQSRERAGEVSGHDFARKTDALFPPEASNEEACHG